jgi:protein ImuB
LASITGERARLLDVVVQKLGRVTLDSPVRGLELISGTLRALSADSLDAFAGLAGQGGRDTAPQLVERLRARLGEAAVYGVCPIAEHRPEAAWRRVRELELKSSKLAAPPPLPGAMPRPIWLLAEPQPLSSPQLLEGPERIESGWWDGKGVARDYYVARSGSGERLWVFQERRSRRWYLHGVFA